MLSLNAHQVHAPERYPLNKIVAVLPAYAVDAVLMALQTNVDAQQIEVAHGAAEAQRVEHSTTGYAARLRHFLMSTDEGHQARTHYLRALRAGYAVLRVAVSDEATKQRVCSLLAQHGGRTINFYGRWSVETFVA